MKTIYLDDTSRLTPDELIGFFVGWPNPPSPRKHLEILQNSQKVWLAFDNNKCVGFINALTDSVFYAFIPLLEVLPSHKNQGIGTMLVSKMVESLKNMYAIDIICDESIVPFYESCDFKKGISMMKRNYNKQSGGQ